MVKVSPRKFVNRSEDLEKLISGFEEVMCGRGKMFFVRGKEGVGKTALVDFFLEGVTDEVRVLRIKCERGKPPLYTLLRQIQKEIGLKMEVPPQHLMRVAEGIVDMDPTISTLLLRVSILTIRDEESFRDIGSLGRANLFKILLRELEEMAKERPVVLMVDALEYGDVDMLLFLHFLSRWIPHHPIMAVVTYNPYLIGSPEMRDVLMRFSREGLVDVIRLEPFGEDQMRELLEKNYLVRPSRRFLSYLMKKTAGNLHYVRMLLSGDRMEQGSLFSIVKRRVEELSPDERRVLLLISLFPGGITFDELTEIMNDIPDPLDAMEGMMDLGLVEEHLERLMPATASVREIAIAISPPETYRDINLKIAKYLEERSVGDILSLAWHYREAGDIEKASHYYLIAVKEFISDMSLREAQVVIHEASERVKEPERSRIYVYYMLLLYMEGNLDALIEVMGEVDEKCLTTEEKVAYHLTKCYLYTELGNLEEARREGRTAIELTDDPMLRSEGFRAIGNTYYFEGEYAEAERYYLQAESIAPRKSAVWARAVTNLALVRWSWDPQGTKRVLEEVMGVFEEQGDYYSYLRTRINLLYCLLREGRHYEALRGALEIIRVTDDLGLKWFSASARLVMGIAMLVEGRYRRAMTVLRTTMHQFSEIKYTPGYIHAKALYLYARAQAGEERALEEMDMLATEAEMLGYIKTSRYVMLLLANLLRSSGRREESDAILEELGVWTERVGKDPMLAVINGGVPHA